MSEENDKDLDKTKELFALLQGECPEDCTIQHMPKLTADQAWTVIWWLGNQYWQPTDAVERCCVCGDLYHSWQEGECMDYGNAPYHFCDTCRDGEEARLKRRLGLRLERSKERRNILSNAKVSESRP